MLKYINETAEKPKAISLFTKIGCPFCAKAKQMLSDRGFDYEEIVLGRDASPRTLRAVTGASTVPQVFVEGNLIGGSEDLAAYLGAN
ncbi:glutathione S-transferase N-terminal domain-containing protein [Leptolyngbya boryana IU 594]|nr:glutathione S-transferase N-terminal domain-containing protein [Leptolyngbya boryana IU 594]